MRTALKRSLIWEPTRNLARKLKREVSHENRKGIRLVSKIFLNIRIEKTETKLN